MMSIIGISIIQLCLPTLKALHIRAIATALNLSSVLFIKPCQISHWNWR